MDYFVEDIKTEFKEEEEEVKIPVPSWMQVDNDEEDPLALTQVKIEDIKGAQGIDSSDAENVLGKSSLKSHQDRRICDLEDDLLSYGSDSDNSIFNYSDSSANDYVPQIDELEHSDVDEFLESELAANVVQTPTFIPIDLDLPELSNIRSSPDTTRKLRLGKRQRQTKKKAPMTPWVEVHPPEPKQDITSKFTVANAGPRNTPVTSNPLAFLYLFMTNAMWTLMVNETNKNAHAMLRQRQEAGMLKQHSRLSKWVDVTIEEMKKFWGILINMGLTPRNNLADYWSSGVTQAISFYPMTMTLKRFELITTMFHLSSSDCPERGQPGYDPWLKIRDFVHMMNDSFKKYFIPKQEICINESIIGLKNHRSFIQYMPNKKHGRFGIKKFELCDSATSYVLHVSLYRGKDFLADDIDDPFTKKVVKDLMTKADCLGKGYHLFTDSYYMKIPLCDFLLSNNTYLTGMINKISKELPKDFVQAELAEGRTLYFRQSDTLLVKYKAKRTRKPVLLVTTACHAEDIAVTSKRGVVKTKPLLIRRYNSFFSGLNNKDKNIYHLTCSRPCKKFWRNVVYNFVDMAIFNAWILFKAQNSQYRRRHDFMVDIVHKLCFEPDFDVPVRGLSDVQLPAPPISTATSSPIPLSPHKLTTLPGNGNARLCVVCKEDKGIRSRSRFCCLPCNAAVHRNCFPQLRHFLRGGKGRMLGSVQVQQ